MILILCANAGVDRTYEVPEFTAGHFHRPDRTLVSAGGKGINVARVLVSLRQPVTVAGFAGGRSGAFVAADLRGAGIRLALTQIREESRTTLTIVDPRNKRVTRLDEWGPLVSPAEIEALRQAWIAALPGTQIAAISGNPPRGVPRDLYARLLHYAARENIPTALDAHEEHLQEALAGRPSLLKPNLRELSWLAKRPLEVPEGVVTFSRELLRQGIGAVMTTLGKQGAIVVSRDSEALLVAAPQTEALSSVGAGDAALAGYLAALREGRPLTERARWAMAAGAANCAALGAATCTRAQVEEMVPQITVEPVE
jgi:1-phosphofructokinase family hexose kinase